MAAAKQKAEPVNEQIEAAVGPLRDQVEKLVQQNEDLAAQNELLQEALAGEILKFGARIDKFEAMLGDPGAGAKDGYARVVLGALLVLLKSQRVELSTARQGLADRALRAGAQLIRESERIRDDEKKDKVKELTSDG